MNVDNENECIDVVCHRLCFHQLSCVAEVGSTFVCQSQFRQMNDDVQSRRERFVGGGEDGCEGVRREQCAHEQGYVHGALSLHFWCTFLTLGALSLQCTFLTVPIAGVMWNGLEQLP